MGKLNVVSRKPLQRTGHTTYRLSRGSKFCVFNCNADSVIGDIQILNLKAVHGQNFSNNGLIAVVDG